MLILLCGHRFHCLDLPVPEAEYENVVLEPSDYQKDMVASLAAVSYTHLGKRRL